MSIVYNKQWSVLDSVNKSYLWTCHSPAEIGHESPRMSIDTHGDSFTAEPFGSF